MNYEIIIYDFMGVTQKHVFITCHDGLFESFPVDEGNPRYQRFLEEV